MEQPRKSADAFGDLLCDIELSFSPVYPRFAESTNAVAGIDFHLSPHLADGYGVILPGGATWSKDASRPRKNMAMKQVSSLVGPSTGIGLFAWAG